VQKAFIYANEPGKYSPKIIGRCRLLTGFVGAGLQTAGGAALWWWLVSAQRQNADLPVPHKPPVVPELAGPSRFHQEFYA
jgi:hypothetical protein